MVEVSWREIDLRFWSREVEMERGVVGSKKIRRCSILEHFLFNFVSI